MVKIKITVKKNGQEVASFRDSKGRRVRTRVGTNWTRARTMMRIGLYAIQLHREQAMAGIGSDGSAMPGLKKGYAIAKSKLGLGNRRNLYGPGRDGHMLDDIRVNYVDDARVTYAITRRNPRVKALANEQKAPWWDLSPANQAKLKAFIAQEMGLDIQDHLAAAGLVAIDTISRAGRFLRAA